MNKKRFLFLLLSFCTVKSMPAGAPVIGVVDVLSVQKHVQQNSKIKEKAEIITKSMKVLSDEYEALKKSFEAEMKKIQSLASLNQDESKKKMEACQKRFQNKISELQKKEAALKEKMNALSLLFQKKALGTIKEIASAKSISVVLDKSMLLYSDEKVVVDLTKEVSQDTAQKIDESTSLATPQKMATPAA